MVDHGADGKTNLQKGDHATWLILRYLKQRFS